MTLFVVSIILLICSSSGQVTITPLSTIYIPYNYTPAAQFALDKGATEKLAYDSTNKHVYTAGGSGYIHVVDVKKATAPILLHHQYVVGDVTDIKKCGDYVAVVVRDEHSVMPGKAVIYTLYNSVRKNMTRIRDIPVGSSPDGVYFSKNCRIILVADEGELGEDDNKTMTDPEGSVSVIKFASSDLSGPYNSTIVNFTEFNSREDEYTSKGVRHVFPGHGKVPPTTLSQDLEPEYIAFNSDDSIAYIALQENNAIAVLDVATCNITEIHGLGYKHWQMSALDPSDKDKGININPWNIFGIYQPDGMAYFTYNGVGYLVTANEGDAKEYDQIDWSEEKRGEKFITDSLISSSVDSNLRAALNNKTQLGRLKFSLANGKNSTTSKYDNFYAFGARGISIWRADDMALISDSGDAMEIAHAKFYPYLFNGHMGSLDDMPAEDMDERSDDKGPEPESIDIAEINGDFYIFVGNERSSSLAVFLVAKPRTANDKPSLQLETVYRPGRTDMTWQQLYDQRIIGDIDPEDVKFVSAADSPSGRPLIIMTGTVSGTVSLYDFHIEKKTAMTTSSTVNLAVTPSTLPSSCFILLIAASLWMWH